MSDDFYFPSGSQKSKSKWGIKIDYKIQNKTIETKKDMKI